MCIFLLKFGILAHFTEHLVHLRNRPCFQTSCTVNMQTYRRLNRTVHKVNRIYIRVEFTRKKSKTAIFVVVFPYFTYLCYITFWAPEYHFIENLKLVLKENQIMKLGGFMIDQWSFHIDSMHFTLQTMIDLIDFIKFI